MSGRKCMEVRHSPSSYSQIDRVIRQSEAFRSDLASRLNSLGNDLRREIDQSFGALSGRMKRFEGSLETMGSEMRTALGRQQRAIEEQGRAFQRGLADVAGRLDTQRHELMVQLSEQESRFDIALDRQRSELAGEINGLRQEIDAKEQGKSNRAGIWLADLQTLLDYIETDLKPEKFRPGELCPLFDQLGMARANHAHGDFEAAMACAQQTAIRAADLRMDLERLEREWLAHLEIARTAAARVLAAAEAEQTARLLLETSAGREEIAAEVDFWSGGALSSLKAQAEDALARLETPEGLGLDDLKGAINLSEGHYDELLGLVGQAKDALIKSHMRYLLGEQLSGMLAEMGFAVEDSGFQEDDDRRTYQVVLRNLAGERIVVSVEPVRKTDGILNELNLDFHFANPDEQVRRNLAEDISQRLNSGTDVSAGPVRDVEARPFPLPTFTSKERETRR